MSNCNIMNAKAYINATEGPTEDELCTRIELYKTLPKNAIVAEIGVDKGGNAADIYEICSPKELYLIDPWDMCEWSNARWDTKKHKDIVLKHFADKDNVALIQDYSIDASKKFDNHYFDWIHIDSNYEYAAVKADLAHWLPKIKKGGYITQDDFDIYATHWPAYGAIVEFIIKYVAKKPEILEDMRSHIRPATVKQLKEQCTPDADGKLNWLENDRRIRAEFCQQLVTISSKKDLFADITVTVKEEYVLNVKLSPEHLKLLLNYIEYFPSKRFRGGSYKLQIGDWADDLNYEEIIEEALKVEKGSIIDQGLSQGRNLMITLDKDGIIL